MAFTSIGFIGLGTMGGAMCRNLARKFPQAKVTVFDLNAEALAAQTAPNVVVAKSVGEVAAGSDLVFLSMPDGAAVQKVVEGMRAELRSGTIVVDTSTSDVAMTRALQASLATQGVQLLDAPIARTRQAAEDGTLAIMVGGDRAVFDQVKPVLAAMGTELNYCGPSGSGQVVKIMNNMVVFQTVNALSEALAIAEAEGVEGTLLFDVFSRSSADSFTLRNHGMKALMKGDYPLRAFSTRYARKDNAYARALAQKAGLKAQGAELLERLMGESEAAGFGDEYFPALHKLHRKP